MQRFLGKFVCLVVITCSYSHAQDQFQIAVCNAYDTAEARKECLAEIGPVELTPKELSARRTRAAMRNPGQYIGWSKNEIEAALAGKVDEAGNMDFRNAEHSMRIGVNHGRVQFVELDFLQHRCRNEVLLDARALFEEIGSENEELAPLTSGRVQVHYLSRNYKLVVFCDKPGRPYEMFWFAKQ